MAKRISCTVTAYHNVKDFRPYKIHFVDKGLPHSNLIHALKLAIKKEGEWNGWFDEFGELFEQRGVIERDLDNLLSLGLNEDNEWFFEGFDWEAAINPKKGNDVGLVVFLDFKLNSFGFGIAHRDERSNSVLTYADTDKYQVKWISLNG